MLKLDSCHTYVKSLGWSSTGSLAIRPEYVSPYELKLVVCVFAVMVISPVVHTLLSSLLLSTGLPHLDPMLDCGFSAPVSSYWM